MINDISELITALWQREFSVTVELNMLKEDTEYKSTSEVENTKPQLRMVDLNLLTVFDAVMQEQNITRAAHSLGKVRISRSFLPKLTR